VANRLPEFDSILLDLYRASLIIPNEGNGAPACAQLIQDVTTQGREQFVREHTQTPGTNVYRLNGDELKLRYDVEFYRDGDETKVYVINLRIEGDQAENYPAFVRATRPILEAAKATARAAGATRRAG
jgi:hypothetical protein